jgi:hypothetical protein
VNHWAGVQHNRYRAAIRCRWRGKAEEQHAVGDAELGGNDGVSRKIHAAAGPDIVGIVATSLPIFWRARQRS